MTTLMHGIKICCNNNARTILNLSSCQGLSEEKSSHNIYNQYEFNPRYDLTLSVQ